MATPNEEIRDGLIRRQIYLSRYSGGLANESIRLLNATERDLERQLRDRADTIAAAGRDRGPSVTARLKALYEDARQTREAAFDAIGKKMEAELGDLAGIEAEALKDLIEGLSPVDLGIALPKARTLGGAVNSLFNGDTLKGWLSRMKDADFNRIKDQIAVGVLQGETTDGIARRIFGTAQLDWKDGATQITRNGARTLARTAVNHVANSSRQSIYEANANLIEKELYVATLDSRTSPICRSLDGKTFPVGKGPVPPLHPNCRSTRVPVIAPLEGERESQFGAVPVSQTYGPWLKSQTAAFQDDVLGPERGKLFRLGGLEIEKFNDASGKLYTLNDLKIREPQAFARAFGPGPATPANPAGDATKAAGDAIAEAARIEAARLAEAARKAAEDAARAAAKAAQDAADKLAADLKAQADARKAAKKAAQAAYNQRKKAAKAAAGQKAPPASRPPPGPIPVVPRPEMAMDRFAFRDKDRKLVADALKKGKPPPRTFSVSTDLEKRQVEAAFARSDGQARSILDMMPQIPGGILPSKVGDGSYWSSGSREIRMRMTAAPGEFSAVLRHELGHFIDDAVGSDRFAKFGEKRLSSQAIKTLLGERKQIDKAAKSAAAAMGSRVQAYQRARDNLQLWQQAPYGARPRLIAEALEESKSILTMNDFALLGFDWEKTDVLNAIASIIEAERIGDFDNFLKQLHALSSQTLDGKEPRTVILHVNDYIQAVTHRFGLGHTDAYYKGHAKYGGKGYGEAGEAFANHYNVMGASPKLRDLGERILKRIVPKTFGKIQELFDGIPVA